MFLTIIVFYAFMVRCLKRENKLIAPEKSSESTTTSVSSSLTTSTSSSSITTSIAYNNVLKDSPLNKSDNKEGLPQERKKGDNSNSDEDNNFDAEAEEADFYRRVEAAAFQSKRNSSVSSGSFYDNTKRNSQSFSRSQSSCSEIIDETTTVQMGGSRRSSEDRIQNRKLNKRRIGWKRRRTTGRY